MTVCCIFNPAGYFTHLIDGLQDISMSLWDKIIPFNTICGDFNI